MQAILASACGPECGGKVAPPWSAVCTSRRLLAACGVVLGLSGAGCSTLDFAHSMGPTALTLMADSYLDLDSEQETLVKDRLLAKREWLRVSQMADYAGLLQEVRKRAAGRVSTDDLAWLNDEVRKRWPIVGARLANDIADLAPRLKADNLAALRRKLARNNAEFTKLSIDAPLEKQRERRFERFKDNLERWYGNLEEAQLEQLRAFTDALPANPRLMLEERKRRQEALLATLAEALDAKTPRDQARARLVAQLTVQLTEWERGRSAAYQVFAQAWMAQNRSVAADMINSATQVQRETAQRRFKRWADDFAALAARREP